MNEAVKVYGKEDFATARGSRDGHDLRRIGPAGDPGLPAHRHRCLRAGDATDDVLHDPLRESTPAPEQGAPAEDEAPSPGE